MATILICQIFLIGTKQLGVVTHISNPKGSLNLDPPHQPSLAILLLSN